jgi:2-methylcitrate dehydratase PrpD
MGAPHILEAPYGFINQNSSKPNISIYDHLGDPWEITRSDLKRWCAGIYHCPAIDCVVDICTDNDVKPHEIEEITLELCNYLYNIGATPEEARRNLPHPMNGKISFYWLAGCAAVHRRVFITEFEPDVFYSSEIREISDKVKCISNPEFDKDFPAKLTTACTIKTKDGRTLTKKVDYLKGSPEDPFSWDEIADKWRRIYRDGGGAQVISKGRSEEILTRFMNMEKEKDIGKLVELCASDTGYE